MGDDEPTIDKAIPLPADEIVIERGVPLPAWHSGKHKYPLREMEIGDSFFITQQVDSLRSLVQRCYDEDGSRRRFAIRVEGHGWRVWRVK